MTTTTQEDHVKPNEAEDRVAAAADDGGEPTEQTHRSHETHRTHETQDQRPATTDTRAQWRDRAKLAEQEALDLKRTLETVRDELREARESLEATERRQRIERELAREEAIDADALALLTQAALATSEATDDDIRSAVAELKRKKPHLFGKRAGSHGNGAFRSAGAMSPIATGGAAPIDTALEAARGSGNRRDLLNYLRLKRSA